MTTDFENELRDLFREKAADAPLATPSVPASAPQQVLRRGRLHQVGTVIGSAVVVVALIVGSVAGLTRILGEGWDDRDIGGGGYEVFQRTAAIEAFRITSPSDWYLVSQWPGWPQETEHVLPVMQLSNVDLGMTSNACQEGLPPGATSLSVVFTGGHIIDSDPYGPWPTEFEANPLGSCTGDGEYAHFTVSGWALFAWVGFGEGVTEEDRDEMMTAVRSMTVADAWEPETPDGRTPAYVLAGGVTEGGEDWRLDLWSEATILQLVVVGGVDKPSAGSFTVPAVPVEWAGSDPIFGAVTKAATGVEYRPGAEDAEHGYTSPVPGTIMPVPPSMGAVNHDLFFIDSPATYGEHGGHVAALGVDAEQNASPPPVAEPRDEVVELSETYEGQPWTVRFTGTFADQTACIHVTVAETFEPSCHDRAEHSFASSQPSSDAWLTDELYMQVSSVVPEVVELRYVGDDDAIVPSQFRCAMGPLGWTNPDRKVCVIVLPPNGSGTLEFLDADGDVLFEQGLGWGLAEPEVVVPVPVDPVHGGTYWAVYPWVGPAGSPEADDVSAQLMEEFGIQAFPGDLSCDDGAAEALGTDAEQGIGVYFETQDEANEFASQAGLLGHEANPVIARVTTYCLD